MAAVPDVRVVERHAWGTQRVQCTCSIVGAGARNRHQGRQLWRPTSAVVSWERRRGQGEVWGPWKPVQIIARGPWLRPDGTSMNRSEHREEWVHLGGDALTDALIASTRPMDGDATPAS